MSRSGSHESVLHVDYTPIKYNESATWPLSDIAFFIKVVLLSSLA